MKLAYILTQFPYFTETFVGREISAVKKQSFEVEIYSLKKFDAWDEIHEDMHEFKGNVHYSNMLGLNVIKSNLNWLSQRPGRYLFVLSFLLSRFFNNPTEVLKAIFSFPLIAHYARLQSQSGVTHIHSHFARMGATSAFVCAELIDCPFSFTVHAFDIFLGRDDPYLARKLSSCKSVMCISNYNINYLMEVCPEVDQDKFEIVRCGIEATRISVCQHLDGGASIKILSVGSLIEKKGHRYLVKAIGGLVEKGMNNVACDIIGEGPDRKALEKLIRENKLDEHVRLRGNQTQDVVNACLEECDIFVLACINARDGDRDGIPVALMEAMAQAKPVISTYISGIPELIQSHENGLLVPERNVPALAMAIREIADDMTLKISLGENAVRTIQREFTIEKNVSKLIKIFER